MTKSLTVAMLLAGAGVLAACQPKPPEQLPPPPADTSTDVDTTPAQTAQGPQPGSQAHFIDAVNGQNVIFFDTDRFNIDSSDAAALQTQAQYLSRYPGVNVTLEGHTDERGTREYNLALGERRANAAKNYLVGIGVDASRIRTVSYGKERPVALASNETAWAQNRRAVTIVIE
ncbi:peptidoglycan-associated lipoprotein Pal [Altererythrobacter sp. MF3-039]|uniref:peptidoglycan-associated lipoprotein Pal n=1 Tax=Altererythrobacter sp. MF3-039 TaxID=3252901 RepID=UPI00390CB351